MIVDEPDTGKHRQPKHHFESVTPNELWSSIGADEFNAAVDAMLPLLRGKRKPPRPLTEANLSTLKEIDRERTALRDEIAAWYEQAKADNEPTDR